MITLMATTGVGPRDPGPIKGNIRLPRDATPIRDRSVDQQLVGHHVGTRDKSLGIVADEPEGASAVRSHQSIVWLVSELWWKWLKQEGILPNDGS